MPDPALCTESINENYTLGTFDLFLQAEGGTEFLVGNISAGSFDFTPTLVEHRTGKTNSLDAIFSSGKDYTIAFTGDELTARNLAALLNEDFFTVAEGCEIPLTGERCTRQYGVRLVHEFPCQDKSLEITFWRAALLADFSLNFGTEFASFTGSARALSCESAHPTQPYGKILISEPCPAS